MYESDIVSQGSRIVFAHESALRIQVTLQLGLKLCCHGESLALHPLLCPAGRKRQRDHTSAITWGMLHEQQCLHSKVGLHDRLLITACFKMTA